MGPLRLVATREVLTAVDFLGPMPTGPAESRSVQRFGARAEGRPLGERTDDDPLLREAARQLAAYFVRDLKDFDLPVAPTGSDFQLRVWAELRRIPYGEVRSYGEVARGLGLSGQAARAVGVANGRNPVPVIVPCHRVVGADGSLTGYGGGLERKQLLLRLEQDAPSRRRSRHSWRDGPCGGADQVDGGGEGRDPNDGSLLGGAAQGLGEPLGRRRAPRGRASGRADG